MGIRFQTQPREAPSEILVHLHLRDSSAVYQQEALGLFGVNLVHAAFFHRDEPVSLVRALVEELPRGRVEIDLLKVAGPAFPEVDNRLVSLQFVERGPTDAAMFGAGGDLIQPSEVLHKQLILVERGSFRPATNLTLDLLERARDQFRQEPEVYGQTPVVLAEMTLCNLLVGGDAEHADFLARAEVVGALGFDVLISRFQPYYELAEYLTAYTDGLIGIAVGLPSVRQIADGQYYTHLPGGVLESMGRLFKRSLKMYVYPALDPTTGRIDSVERAPVPAPWHHLRDLLLEIKRLEPIRNYNESYLSIHTPDVLARIERGDPSWEGMVPPAVASIIKRKGLFRRNAAKAVLTA